MELTLLQRAEEAERATAADEFRIIGEAALAIFGWQDERYKHVLRLLDAGASIDTAISLVPEGAYYTLKRYTHEQPPHWAYVGDDREPSTGIAATAALALCAASLRARAAQGDELCR